MEIELLRSNELPAWFTYPPEFLELLQTGVTDIGPWQILQGDWLRVRLSGIKKRFPDRELIPFARRLDDDDIACWDRRQPLSVYVVHDFCAPGWEDRGEYESFQAWYMTAQEDAKNYDD